MLSAPVVGERLIAVRTVDGRLHGIALKDGQELWTQEQQVPRLSLRGTSWPVLVGDLVLSGSIFDDERRRPEALARMGAAAADTRQITGVLTSGNANP